MSGRPDPSGTAGGARGKAVRLCGRVTEPFAAGPPRAAPPACTGAPPAAMRRQLLGGLRDAFAAGAVRLDALRHAMPATGTPGLRQVLARTAGETEAQQRRLDYAFASLRDLAGGGHPGRAKETRAALHRLLQGSPGAGRDAALAGAIRDELAWAAEDAATLRLLAQAVGLRRVAGLLDATAAELRAAAAECGRFAPGREHPTRN